MYDDLHPLAEAFLYKRLKLRRWIDVKVCKLLGIAPASKSNTQ